MGYEKKLPEPELVYVIDFFCGCGGMSWGFENTRQSHAAFKVLAGFDIDEKALETYNRNIGASGIKADVREIAETTCLLTRLIAGFDPAVHRPLVFIGCAPCQGFSAHRKKDDRDDPRNNLMLAFAKICRQYKPDAVVMENVPEILTGRYRDYYRQAANELKQQGYSLTDSLLDLSLYGVPQRRRRAIVLGTLNGSLQPPPPVFTTETAPTVRDAIAHLSRIEAAGIDPTDPFHKAPDHTERILERIRQTPPDGGDRRDLPTEAQLECHANLDEGETPGFTDVYGRLRWDAPSVTITAKSSTPSCGRFLHPEQHRNITVREAAILQGFPQSFVFEGPFVNQYRQIGEAVPPLFARSLAWQVLDHFRPKQADVRTLFPAPRTVSPTPDSGATTGPKVVDAFCGAGGLALGFEAAGFETAYGFDLDRDAVATFQRNLGSPADPLSVTDPETATRIGAVVNGAPFVVVGGPPCQGFSQQRRGVDKDPRNNLILRYAEMIRTLEHKPLAVVLENVTYLDSPRGKKILAKYVTLMQGLGYEIRRHDLHSADFGVPQLRRRIVIVALAAQVAKCYAEPETLTPSRWTTVGEALSGIPMAFEEAALAGPFPNHVPSAEGTLNRRRIAYVDMGKGRLAIPPHLQLGCHTRYGGHLDVYGRLDWFSQARTITAGFDSFTRGEFGHPFKHRSLTPREAARIQGFPDWFEFHGNRYAVRHQIGNAVPPPMAYAIGKALLGALQGAGEGG